VAMSTSRMRCMLLSCVMGTQLASAQYVAQGSRLTSAQYAIAQAGGLRTRTRHSAPRTLEDASTWDSWGTWSPGTPPSPEEVFDCTVGYSDWQMQWSMRQKSWCCKHASRGCSSGPFICKAGYDNWEQGWSDDKKAWCCKSEGKGCTKADQLFDCQVGMGGQEDAWISEQRAWCCATEGIACPLTTASTTTSKPFDCQVGYQDWRRGFSKLKKEWCCEHEKLACEVSDADLFDCMDGYEDQSGWLAEKKQWCHDHKGIHIISHKAAASTDAAVAETPAITAEPTKTTSTVTVTTTSTHTTTTCTTTTRTTTTLTTTTFTTRTTTTHTRTSKTTTMVPMTSPASSSAATAVEPERAETRASTTREETTTHETTTKEEASATAHHVTAQHAHVTPSAAQPSDAAAEEAAAEVTHALKGAEKKAKKAPTTTSNEEEAAKHTRAGTNGGTSDSAHGDASSGTSGGAGGRTGHGASSSIGDHTGSSSIGSHASGSAGSSADGSIGDGHGISTGTSNGAHGDASSGASVGAGGSTDHVGTGDHAGSSSGGIHASGSASSGADGSTGHGSHAEHARTVTGGSHAGGAAAAGGHGDAPAASSVQKRSSISAEPSVVATRSTTSEPPTTPEPSSSAASSEPGGDVVLASGIDTTMSCSERDITWEPIDMDGQPLTVEIDIAACQARCAGVPECAHYSFWPSHRMCHLQSVFAVRQTNRLGFISGPPGCTSVQNSENTLAVLTKKDSCFEDNVAYEAFDMQGTEPTIAKTADECQDRCAETPNCKHFTYNIMNRMCHVADKDAMRVPSMVYHVAGPPVCTGVVSFRIAIDNLNYHKLEADKELVVGVKAAVQEAVSAKVGDGVSPKDVSVELSDGSGAEMMIRKLALPYYSETPRTMVKVSIYLPVGGNRDHVNNVLGLLPSLNSAIAASLHEVSGLSAVASGTITVSKASRIALQDKHAGKDDEELYAAESPITRPALQPVVLLAACAVAISAIVGLVPFAIKRLLRQSQLSARASSLHESERERVQECLLIEAPKFTEELDMTQLSMLSDYAQVPV